MGRIGRMLGFQAQRRSAAIHHPVIPAQRGVDEVPRIHLHPRLIALHRHAAATVRLSQQGHPPQALAPDDEMMVIALCPLELCVLGVDALSERMRGGEVKRGSVHAGFLPGGNQGGIHRGVGVGLQRQVMSQDITGPAVFQIPVRMVGEVDQGGGVGGGGVVEAKFIGSGHGVAHRDCEGSGIAFLTVGAVQPEFDGLPRQLLSLPQAGVEALHAAVQGVGAVVAGELIAVRVQLELPLGEAVGDASDGGPEVAGLGVVTDRCPGQDGRAARRRGRRDDPGTGHAPAAPRSR